MMQDLFFLQNKSSALFLILDKNTQKLISKPAMTKFLKPFFPYGRCLALILPDIQDFEIIKAVQIFTRPPGLKIEDARYKILLTDPSTSQLILPAHSEMDGDDIAIEFGRYKEKQFTIKIEVSKNMDNDPAQKWNRF